MKRAETAFDAASDQFDAAEWPLDERGTSGREPGTSGIRPGRPTNRPASPCLAAAPRKRDTRAGPRYAAAVNCPRAHRPCG